MPIRYYRRREPAELKSFGSVVVKLFKGKQGGFIEEAVHRYFKRRERL